MRRAATIEAIIQANERQIADRERDYTQHLKKECSCPKGSNYRCDGHKRAILSTIRLIKEANYKLGQERLKAISLEKQYEDSSKIRGRKQPKLRKKRPLQRATNASR